MARGDRIYVFCYDVVRDSARNRIAKTLEAHAIRVQRSVFEGVMNAEAAERLTRKLSLMIEPGDSLRVYAVSQKDIDAISVLGAGLPPELHEFYLF